MKNPAPLFAPLRLNVKNAKDAKSQKLYCLAICCFLTDNNYQSAQSFQDFIFYQEFEN